MARFEVILKRAVARDLRSISKQDVVRILDCIRSLGDDSRPEDARKLSGQERYRIRVGLHRVLYEITDGRLIVVVVKIGHRRDVYRHQ